MSNYINIIIIILLILLFLSLQLLLIIILFIKKQEFGKAKDKSILFTLKILDELLNSKNKEELEKLHKDLTGRKEEFFEDLILDFKKLSVRDKKILKDELDMIFKKIDDSFQEKLGDYSTNKILDKIELIFDKISDAISIKTLNDTSIEIPTKLSNNNKLIDNVTFENNNEVTDQELNKKFAKFEKLKNQETSPAEEFKKVPKIPKEFFSQNLKNNELADQIRSLSIEHTELQVLLEEIHKSANANKLSLLISTNKEFSFIEIHKIGFNDKEISRVILNEHNILIKHLYSMKRIIYVKNYKKYGNLFTEIKTIQALKEMKALFLFPIKYYGDIRALILLFFNEDNNNELGSLVDIFKSYTKLIKKNIMKLL